MNMEQFSNFIVETKEIQNPLGEKIIKKELIFKRLLDKK